MVRLRAERGTDVGWLVFGLPYWFIFSLSTELTNRLSDQREDEINQVQRTQICDCVGFGRIWAVAVATWVVASIICSLDARVKTKPYLSHAELTLPLLGSFGLGWLTAGRGSTVSLLADGFQQTDGFAAFPAELAKRANGGTTRLPYPGPAPLLT